METYVAPYVQVRHAIHLLYATSPRSRDGAGDQQDAGEAGLNGAAHKPTLERRRADAPDAEPAR